ncbi:MAG: type II toxin-antitoxin system prevent-host-death family antitoxin [Bryobacteraceae bacterium]
MRKTSVRDLHINTSALVREAEEGGTIVIERRGEPVAELRPLAAKAGITPEQKERIFAEMREIWARMPQMGTDSTQLVSEDRDRY